ncbi:SRPBCC domain-containing protein [Sphingobium sp. MAH-33]|uniref:SRPBCC domain-containing protein n=1 Tax=Sphingobium agri TaxID=2933566 RepID=A0ABT0DSK6_9SPHN|nr:SRPBCC domain-containing protein [Sphingobium agri]
MPKAAMDAKISYDPANVVTSEVVVIEASPALVWEVLTDLDRYGDWNPFCVKATSTLEMGAPVYMSLVNYPNPGALLQGCEYICELQPERRLAWEARWHENWPYAARRDQFIDPMANGHCRYWSTDAFLGENGVHVMRFCGPWVKRAFDDTAHALKARAEALHAERIGR